ncbi:hypothetical protein GCM10010507_50560 [Streptomyces cinnamoneus]|uniref:DUF4245 domain-containing protein n=1 Tax=Streptomyces cinnamoneus TaxID=53446 RepID=A0A918TXK1_STRCJ|nr:hypothetical protein GCM10010507_50560 [Streptomyces cinnamoneus]
MGDDGGVAGRNGKTQTIRNMLLSMAVVIPVAGLSYLFIPHDESKDPIKTVNYRVELDTARRAAPYAVAAPVGLGDGWRATSVSYKARGKDGSEWHLGFLDPQKQYVAVEQSDGPARPFIDNVSQHAEKAHATTKVGDTTWQRYEGPKYNALVREESGVTTVVTGTASYERLTQMAAALKAEKADAGKASTSG